MKPGRRLLGIAVLDERPLGGRIVGWMFVVGAVVTTILPALPGSHNAILTPTLAIAVAALVWGAGAESLLAAADAALGSAKHCGKDRVLGAA